MMENASQKKFTKSASVLVSSSNFGAVLHIVLATGRKEKLAHIG